MSAERQCLNCKRWSSYEAIYEDPLEPDDLGVCRNRQSPRFDKGCSISDSCPKFEPEE